MSNQPRTKIIILVCMIGLFAFALSGCGGSSAYLESLAPTIGQFNSAVESVSTPLNALIEDNALFEEATWQSEIGAALSNWKGASEALTKLPEPEEDYVKLNDLVQEMASQSMLATDSFNAAIEAGDITLMNDGSSYLDRVNELLPQINAEIDRINQ